MNFEKSLILIIQYFFSIYNLSTTKLRKISMGISNSKDEEAEIISNEKVLQIHKFSISDIKNAYFFH